MNDEELYLEATNELEGDNRNPALWAKVMTLAEGNQEKAKYQYIKLRVEQLTQEKAEVTNNIAQRPKNEKKSDEFDIKYMPVSQFSRIKSIPENNVIEMIRDGIYSGHVKNNEWYISRDEVDAPDNTTGGKIGGALSINTDVQYIPVETFAEHKGLNPEKVIKMIREGAYVGHIQNNRWYVSRDEVDNDHSEHPEIKARPKSITVIGWALIVFSAFALVVWGAMIGMVTTSEFMPPEAYEALLFMPVAISIQLAMGIGILKGKRWARTLYLWLTPINIVLIFIAGRQTAILQALIYIVFAYILNKPDARSYFGVTHAQAAAKSEN